MTSTDPALVAAATVLRERFHELRPGPEADEGLMRDLADYDRALGLIDGLADGQVA